MGNENPNAIRTLSTNRKAIGEGYRIVALYVIISSLYILLSDRIVTALVSDSDRLLTISLIKGWCFVVATGALLGYLVRRLILKVIARECELQTLIQTIPDLIWLKDLNGRYIAVNQALCSAMNLTAEEMIGNRMHEVSEDDQARRIADLDQTIIETGLPLNWVEQKIAGGRTLFYSVSKLPIFDHLGKVRGVLGVARDITEHKQMEETLRQSEQQFRAVVESSPIGILMADEQGRITLINKEVERAFGYSRRELVGRPVEVLMPNELRAGHVQHRMEFNDSPRSREMSHQDIQGQRKDGSKFPIQVGLSPLQAGNGVYVLATIKDLSEQATAEEKIRKLALFDNLTALPNRNLFNQQLESMILDAKRSSSRVSLLAVNLDRFKAFNDLLGHGVGDQVLKEVAVRLREGLRDKDFIARIGGDDFVVIAPNTNDVAALATKIQAVVNQPLEVGDKEYRVTASVGISSFPHDSQEPAELLRLADMALSSAKEKEAGTFEFYSEMLAHKSSRRLAIETALTHALDRNEFTLHYQPIVDFEKGRAGGAEALIRWNSKDLGFVPPDQFIAIAEESNRILEIGSWVLREACRQAGKWIREGRQLDYISINLSPKQFHDEHLTEKILQVLQECGLQACQLQLEITEGVVIDDPDTSTRVLQHLKSLGVRIAMDDFGTGYSSLSHLKKFPIDCIKIDRSFIQDVPEDDESSAIVASIIGLAKGLKRTVVAEGVETAQQAAFLECMGCESVQGYFFSRPVPGPDFSDLCGREWDASTWRVELYKAA